MNFSKRTLISAALFLGAVSGASAANLVVTPNDAGAYVINLNGETTTLSGALLSENGSIAEQWATNAEWLAGKKLSGLDEATLVITGGGSLTYTGGVGVGSGYYTETYSMTRGDTNTDVGSANWNAWAGMDSFWSAGNFTGGIEVGEGTRLTLQGQISQYVAFWFPTVPSAQNSSTKAFSGYAGVSSVSLASGATLSFEGSNLNMATTRPNLGQMDPTSGYNPSFTLALNFVNNLKAVSDSYLEIGTDEASANRIVLNAEDGFESTVGRLVGNGRLYTTGAGTISFIGKSELNPGSNVNADGSRDVTGNTWIAGNRLADIALGTAVVNVGSSDGGTTVVDNVFENATSVTLLSSGRSNATTTGTASNGNVVNGAADYLGEIADEVVVNVYGRQQFNNFQSLYAERSNLLSDPDINHSIPKTQEPLKFSWYEESAGAMVYNTGVGTKIVLSENSVLTLTNDVGRDGYYSGDFDMAAGGMIVKRGGGRLRTSAEGITNLRIEEGEWIASSAAVSGDVTLAGTGSLSVVVANTSSTNFVVKALDSTSTLRFIRNYYLENDLEDTEDPDNSEYRKDSRITTYTQNVIHVQKQQTLFYGAVSVEEGITLALGGEGFSESVFSNASEIALKGSGASEDAGQWQNSTLDIVSGYQHVRNLSGDASRSAVVVRDGASLVLMNTNTEKVYSGGISGNGNLIKFGANTQRISSDSNGELRGSVFVLSGGVTLVQTPTSSGPAALAMKGTSATFSGTSAVGALVGEKDARISFSGDLTVGNTRRPTGKSDGSYIATSNYDGYANYFSSASAQEKLTWLSENVAEARTFQTGTGSGIVTDRVTLDDTTAYLKNPAELISKRGSTARDGAFSKLYATTTADVFAAMKNADYDGVFGAAASVASWLRAEFTPGNVEAFLATNPESMSDEMCTRLKELAARVSGSVQGASYYLDTAGNLNVTGWNQIVAAGGLEFLKYQHAGAAVWNNMEDETLYSFISCYVPDYQFQLTESNALQISRDYGVNRNSWFTGTTANYDAFAESFGIASDVAESKEFRGSLSGTGNLIKSGAETLYLTGKNAYSGTTVVKQGELFVNWDSIQNTAGVSVESGALLTIRATEADVVGQDDAGNDILLGTNYGEFFSGSRAQAARLSGGGVVLKLGDGRVDLGNAIFDVAEGGEDFTGTIIVGDGALRATMDAASRSAGGKNPSFDLIFSDDAATDAAVDNSAPTFELAFAKTDDLGVFGTEVSELSFEGKIDGSKNTAAIGTFVLDAGVTRRIVSETETAVVGNNVLRVKSENFFVNAARVKSGTLKIDMSDAAVNQSTYDVSLFRKVAVGTGAELFFDLGNVADGVTLAACEIVGEPAAGAASSGTVIVASLEQNVNDAYLQKALTFAEGVKFSSVSALKVVGGATADFADATAPIDADIVLESLSTEAQTTLTIGDNRKLELKGDGVIAGKLKGEGTLSFSGETLTIGSLETGSEQNAFGGTIDIEQGTIEFVAGAGTEFLYTGVNIKSETISDKTLVKSGSGTVKLLREGSADNKIAVEGSFAIDVQAGELAISGNMFEMEADLPSSVKVSTGATFRLCEEFTNGFDLAELGLEGAGTFAIDSGIDLEVTVSSFDTSKFSGVVEITNANTTVSLGENVTEFAAFSGAGTLKVDASDFTVRVNSNADGGESFTGIISGDNLQSLTVVGEGSLVFSNPTSIPVGTINVGSETESGGVGVAQNWTGTLSVVGSTARVLISGDGNFAGETVVGDGVTNLTLAADGTLTLGENAVAEKFQLKSEAGSGELIALDGSVKVTLANIAGTTLTLKNLLALGSENFSLKTNAGGIVFDGSPSSSSFALRNSANSAAPVVWTGDISGDGGVSVSNGANIAFASPVLSYTGATTVSSGSTLTYASSGTVSMSSKLEVASGGTVAGGVSLRGENASVEFGNNSTFVFTGDAIEFTGTAKVVGGRMNVELSEGSLSVRGVPVALFRYVGDADSAYGKNQITLDKLVFSGSEDGVLFYKDEGHDVASSGSTTIYVATDDLRKVGVPFHKGLSSKFISMLSEIATPTAAGELNAGLTSSQKALAEAIIKTPNGSLSATLNNLSPLGYAAMPAMLQSGFLSDVSAISARIEQRRYDNYSSFIWETRNDWEFFVQGQGAFVESDSDTDTRTFDFNTYGAIAGADVKMSASSIAGFAVAYDFGKADLHDGGGDIESNDIRATAFFGKLFADRVYLDAGVQAGFATFDVKRNTVLGSADGDATGWHAGAFANLGMLIPLWISEDEKTSVNLMPFVGLAYSHFGIGSFDESGAATALDTDSIDADSLRASIGASLAVVFPWLGLNTRLNLDFAYSRELLDSETDIDYAMPGISVGEKYSVSAQTFAEDSFSFGPRFSVELDRNSSIYAGYRFEISTDSDVSHSVNLGYRTRF